MTGNNEPFFSFNSLTAEVTITEVVGCNAMVFLSLAAAFFSTGDFFATGNWSRGGDDGVGHVCDGLKIQNDSGRLNAAGIICVSIVSLKLHRDNDLKIVVSVNF